MSFTFSHSSPHPTVTVRKSEQASSCMALAASCQVKPWQFLNTDSGTCPVFRSTKQSVAYAEIQVGFWVLFLKILAWAYMPFVI